MLVVAGWAQPAGWKKLEFDKVSLSYPPTWHLTQERRGQQRRFTVTPDSMQKLSMRMFEIMELPIGEGHDYAFFKKFFSTVLHGDGEANIKPLKTEEITFKGYKAMYAEVMSNSLPAKLYGVDGGSVIYLIVVMERRYSQVADAGIKRDANAILNSVNIGK